MRFFRRYQPTAALSGLSPPSGALGIWYADQYQSSPRPAIPNTLSSAPISSSLMPAPSGILAKDVFSANYFFDVNALTVSDRSQTGPSGEANKASELSRASAGAWYIAARGATTYPAGTYTIAGHYKSLSGSTQSFQMGPFSALSTAKLMPNGAWGRLSHTFVLGSPTSTLAMWASGTGVCDFAACNLELFSGASDLGPIDPSTHMYVGEMPFDTTPTFGGGSIDLSSGVDALIQFAADQTITAFTIIAVIAKVGTSAGGTLVSKVERPTSAEDLRLSVGINATPIPDGIVSDVSIAPTGILAFQVADTCRMVAHRVSGTVADYFIDDALLHAKTVTTGSITLRDLWIASKASALKSGKYKLAALAVYGSALTNAQMKQAYRALRARIQRHSAMLASRIACWEGDSIAAGFAGTSYATQVQGSLSPVCYGKNFAISGSTLVELNSRAATVDASKPSSGTAILHVAIGTNDLSGTYAGNPSGFTAALATYCDARRTAGWKVVVGTILPSTVGGSFIADRDAANVTIRTWAGTHADAIADYAGISGFGGDSDASNATNYADGTHPTTAGYLLMVPTCAAAINSL